MIRGLSWAELGRRVQQAVVERGLDLHVAGRRGLRDVPNGPPNAHAQLRLFGAASENEVRVVFYRDNHAWCPYCHKVWMQLEEKQIPYRVEKVSMNCYGTKSRAFLAKTPRGLLPAVEVDGKFYTESSSIMQLLEDSFPDHRPLIPHGSKGRMAQEFLALERNLFGAWLQWLRGQESPQARKAFEHAMDATEDALGRSGGPYFLGDEFSLVDCVFASSLERIAASILYYKGLKIRGGRWIHVESWFRHMECRESYLASRSDFHTHVHDLPPQIGGCIASGTEHQKAVAAAIDGTDGRSWNLPLPPITMDSLEPGKEDPIHDCLEAANAVVHCHAGILRYSKGNHALDEALRVVVQAMVYGVEKFQQSPEALKHKEFDKSVAMSLRFLRDRICVPRDMSFAAARQLRAHLNWAADIIDPQEKWVGIPLSTHDRKDSDPAAFGAAL